MVTSGCLVTKVRYHRNIAPRSSCNNGWWSLLERFPSGQVISSLFWPFFGVLLPCLRNLSSAIVSSRDHHVEYRMMLRKKYLSWTDWTSTQLTKRTHASQVQRLTCGMRYSRQIENKTITVISARTTDSKLASCYDLCAACSNFTSSRRRVRANIAILYKYSMVQPYLKSHCI